MSAWRRRVSGRCHHVVRVPVRIGRATAAAAGWHRAHAAAGRHWRAADRRPGAGGVCCRVRPTWASRCAGGAGGRRPRAIAGAFARHASAGRAAAATGAGASGAGTRVGRVAGDSRCQARHAGRAIGPARAGRGRAPHRPPACPDWSRQRRGNGCPRLLARPASRDAWPDQAWRAGCAERGAQLRLRRAAGAGRPARRRGGPQSAVRHGPHQRKESAAAGR